jgi:hypothetical protein
MNFYQTDLVMNCKILYENKKKHFFYFDSFFRLLSIGLEPVPSDVLAVKLLTPSTFLVVNILQLYYFHSGWMELITMPR